MRLVSGRPDADPEALAAELFDSAGWSARAGALSERLRVVTDALGSEGDALAAGFVTGAAAVAHLRADPLLPRELAADAAAGNLLRAAYRSYETAFSKALRTWFLEH